MEDTVVEELEAVGAIFSEELSISEGDEGCKLLLYKIRGELMLTVQLNGKSVGKAEGITLTLSD
jgi:hypothetical protein